VGGFIGTMEEQDEISNTIGDRVDLPLKMEENTFRA